MPEVTRETILIGTRQNSERITFPCSKFGNITRQFLATDRELKMFREQRESGSRGWVDRGNSLGETITGNECKSKYIP